MSRRAVVVVGLSAIALGASGCSGDSQAEAESPPVTTTEQVAAIEESFGASGYETSWYGHVTGMKMAHGRLEIATNLDPVRDQETARMVCLAAIKFALDSEVGDGVETAAVFASDGTPLGGCA